ncbi:uracil-DNA glycosylase family protein [Fulvivirgaceae bacterium BMA10]|uniref:Uracil-DNA glycosylase family protein n=1 Tax=Splendidivirga corallicola TaxID=3051826 RepID=A0ABT8KTL1_9BACT|nr:uracil-DNA glycosylase family protein [Fulvivirgaceae bacterium BMA10]
MNNELERLSKEIRACEVCKKDLPLGPNPVFRIKETARINIIGQAPGTKVHASGVPWDDASGRRLREWMGVDPEIFYDATKIAIVPMGFCYPGKGKSGDLPPRPECAPLWHKPLLNKAPEIQLTLLIGAYAQAYYLGDRRKETLTETVKAFEEYLPEYLPLVHPSPRNQIWLKKNGWFEEEVVPFLQQRIKLLLFE